MRRSFATLIVACLLLLCAYVIISSLDEGEDTSVAANQYGVIAIDNITKSLIEGEGNASAEESLHQNSGIDGMTKSLIDGEGNASAGESLHEISGFDGMSNNLIEDGEDASAEESPHQISSIDGILIGLLGEREVASSGGYFHRVIGLDGETIGFVVSCPDGKWEGIVKNEGALNDVFNSAQEAANAVCSSLGE